MMEAWKQALEDTKTKWGMRGSFETVSDGLLEFEAVVQGVATLDHILAITYPALGFMELYPSYDGVIVVRYSYYLAACHSVSQAREFSGEPCDA